MVDMIAVVTGSNKGIGYFIVRELCRRKVKTVYLCSRDEKRGKEAVAKLNEEGLYPTFHQLDVTDKDSIKTFAEHLKKEHGGLDILINNAGVIVKDFFKTTFEDAMHVIDVNYRSIITIQEIIFPIVKDNGRVINISSDCGHISNIKNEYWIKRLTKNDLQMDDIEDFIKWFLDSVKTGKLNRSDFAEMEILAYRISKVALCALTRVQQKNVGRGIAVNSLHPGYVDTDMTKGTGVLTGEESGKAPVYLALDADQSVKGKYFWLSTEKDWADPNLNLYCHFKVFEQRLKEFGII